MTRRDRGFTLIELLAVIAIIGILAALAMVSISNATKRARDAQRQRDLSNIKTALELFAQDNDKYPTEALVVEDLTPDYIKTWPKDPKAGASYEYKVDAANDNYLLRALLEYQATKITLASITCANNETNKGNGVAAVSLGGSGRCFRLTND